MSKSLRLHLLNIFGLSWLKAGPNFHNSVLYTKKQIFFVQIHSPLSLNNLSIPIGKKPTPATTNQMMKIAYCFLPNWSKYLMRSQQNSLIKINRFFIVCIHKKKYDRVLVYKCALLKWKNRKNLYRFEKILRYVWPIWAHFKWG